MASVDRDIIRDAHLLSGDPLAYQAQIAFNSRAVADFLNAEEHGVLLAWATSMKPYLGANGPGRAFRRIDALPHAHPFLETVERRVASTAAVGARARIEAEIGHYLSIISSGGAVHRHRDSSPPGTRHLRCNLFLQVPDRGGRPILWDRVIDVHPRTLFCFYPSEMLHASERVFGSIDRVIVSFGYTVPDTHSLFLPTPSAGAPAASDR